jgi:nucleoside-diphosphate-sugar epimerase
MNIALFGASGATGKLLTERCLAAGHTVSALVRTPDKFTFKDASESSKAAPSTPPPSPTPSPTLTPSSPPSARNPPSGTKTSSPAPSRSW